MLLCFEAKFQVSHKTSVDFTPGITFLHTPLYVKKTLKNNQNMATESHKLVKYISKKYRFENWKTMRNCNFV